MFPFDTLIVFTPTAEPEPHNMRCGKCGATFGPRLGHDCQPRLPVPVDEAARMLLSAAEHIYSRFELHGDTPLLAAAIAAFKRACAGEAETAEQRAEREEAARVLLDFENYRRECESQNDESPPHSEE